MPSDGVHPAMPMFDEQEAKLIALAGALIEGEQSGEATPFDFDVFIAGKRGAMSSRE